jgi:hypothetical protein
MRPFPFDEQTEAFYATPEWQERTGVGQLAQVLFRKAEDQFLMLAFYGDGSGEHGSGPFVVADIRAHLEREDSVTPNILLDRPTCAKESAERGTLGIIQTRILLQLLAFRRVSCGSSACGVLDSFQKLGVNRPI